jgi:hypothetical protein
MSSTPTRERRSYSPCAIQNYCFDIPGELANRRIALRSPLTHISRLPLHLPENNRVASVPSHSDTGPAHAKAAKLGIKLVPATA